jgi:hypothetical protein
VLYIPRAKLIGAVVIYNKIVPGIIITSSTTSVAYIGYTTPALLYTGCIITNTNSMLTTKSRIIISIIIDMLLKRCIITRNNILVKKIKSYLIIKNSQSIK